MNNDRIFTFEKIPSSVEELKSLSFFNQKDYASVAVAAMIAFKVYATNKNLALEMLNSIKGPQQLTTYDISFLNERLRDKLYLADSYFQGASVANGYTPDSPYTLAIKEGAYSHVEDGYVVVYLQSSGANSARGIKLRLKPSTGEWFLWGYSSILSGIRIPATLNDWA